MYLKIWCSHIFCAACKNAQDVRAIREYQKHSKERVRSHLRELGGSMQKFTKEPEKLRKGGTLRRFTSLKMKNDTRAPQSVAMSRRGEAPLVTAVQVQPTPADQQAKADDDDDDDNNECKRIENVCTIVVLCPFSILYCLCCGYNRCAIRQLCCVRWGCTLCAR